MSIVERLPEVTAQAAQGDNAYVALRRARKQPGSSGETSVAEVWHTSDRGRTWHQLPWRRTVWSFLSPAAIARWPPEWVNKMWLDDGKLEIEIFEDGGTDSAWDPKWRATWMGRRWRVRYAGDYEVERDGAIVPAALELKLPGITTPPEFGAYR